MSEPYFAYLRVSGQGQVEGGGFERQHQAIRAFAETKGWAHDGVWKEEGVSGTTSAFARPAFAHMIAEGVPYGIKRIVVERADRLARHLIESEIIFRECRKLGIEVWSADTGEELVFTDADPSRTLIRQILGALSQWEKSVIVKKLAAGRAKKKRETGRCEGRRPYDNDRVVGFILKMRGESLTFRQIARALNAGTDVAPGGGTWNASTVQRIYDRSKNH